MDGGEQFEMAARLAGLRGGQAGRPFSSEEQRGCNHLLRTSKAHSLRIFFIIIINIAIITQERNIKSNSPSSGGSLQV